MRFHFTGIGGIGMSGIARALFRLGNYVQGSDVKESSITQALKKEGIPVFIGHSRDYIKNIDVVVYSTAISPENPEIVEAKQRGLSVWHRSLALNRVMENFYSIGVTGTHGKGTVSSMITNILEVAGKTPSFIIGAILNNFNINSRIVKGSTNLVCEVDESDGSLVNLKPEIAVVSNVDIDHLNYYKSLDDVVLKLKTFIEENPKLEHVVINLDDPGSLKLLSSLNIPDHKIVTFSHKNKDADVFGEIINFRGMNPHFNVHLSLTGEKIENIVLKVPGLYNIENALAAVGCAALMDVPAPLIKKGLITFLGLKNRFGAKKVGRHFVVKDYMSHPTGIKRVIDTLRGIVPEGTKIVTVFKPYRFTMVKYLQNEYRNCFEKSDLTIITELFPAGEEPISGIDSRFLVKKINDFYGEGKAFFVKELSDIVPFIKSRDLLSDPTAFLFFGGDDLFEVADSLALLIEKG